MQYHTICFLDIILAHRYIMKLLAALPSRQPQPNPSDAPQECPAAFWSGRSRTPSIFTGTIASELGLLWIHDRQAQDRPDRVERLRGKLRWIAIDQQARSIRYYARPAPAYVPAAPEWNAGADVCWRWCHADGSSAKNNNQTEVKKDGTGRPITLESHLQKLKAIEDKIRSDLTDSKLKHDQYTVLTKRLQDVEEKIRIDLSKRKN